MLEQDYTGETEGEATARNQWTTPRLTRMVAGEAEFNPVFTTDAEGTS